MIWLCESTLTEHLSRSVPEGPNASRPSGSNALPSQSETKATFSRPETGEYILLASLSLTW
jgi:hypothetical protein